MSHLWENVYSHLSEEERQVIQIDGSANRLAMSIRGIARDAGPQPVRHHAVRDQAATHGSAGVQRVNEVVAARTGAKRLKCVGHGLGAAACIAGPAQRQADRSEIQVQLKALPAVARPPVGAGGRMAGPAEPGRRCSISGRLRVLLAVTMRSCACARTTHPTDGSTPAGRFGNAGRGACRDRAQRGAAGTPAGGRRAVPIPRPSAHRSERPPE